MNFKSKFVFVLHVYNLKTCFCTNFVRIKSLSYDCLPKKCINLMTFLFTNEWDPVWWKLMYISMVTSIYTLISIFNKTITMIQSHWHLNEPCNIQMWMQFNSIDSHVPVPLSLETDGNIWIMQRVISPYYHLLSVWQCIF